MWTVPSAMPLDLDTPDGQRLPGLGVTLPAKCHAHLGGERRAGRGTCFTFTLPVAEDAADAAGPAPRGSRQPSEGEERPRILVVDDDPHALRYVRDILAEADYAPVVTSDPEELPELIRTHKPQPVLLDLVLPDTDGIKLKESLRELDDLPVIFISAYGRDETVVRALDAGAADYIREALFIVGVDGAGAGGAALARRAGALHAGGPGDSLRGPPRHRGRPPR